MRADDQRSRKLPRSSTAKLIGAGVEPLYDDRDERGGAKLASMDLIGLPWQLIVGPRGIATAQSSSRSGATGERHELSDRFRACEARRRMILNRAERMLARRYLLPGKGEGFIFLVAASACLRSRSASRR